MRLGLFESATISFWVVAPGCLSWGDLAVRYIYKSYITIDIYVSTLSIVYMVHITTPNTPFPPPAFDPHAQLAVPCT